MKNSLVFGGHLIDLQLLGLRSFSCCWGFPFCIGILFGHMPDWVHNAARVVPFLVVPANLHEGGVQIDAILGVKAREMGSVSKLVTTNAWSV